MAKELLEGDPAPDFELPTDGGGRAHLKDLRGKPVVIYFYPKDDTSGCTAEAIAFNGLRAKFAAAGATIIGVSPDSAASHDKFKHKHELKIVLAAELGAFGDRGLWGVEGKEHVWAQIFRRRALDLSHRPQWPHRQGLAQGESARPRGRGPRDHEGALTRPSWPNAILRSINLNELCLAVGHALFARLERWFMSLRADFPEAGPPGSHYCLSLCRGDAIRTVRLGRVGVGAIAALALLSFAWTASVTLYVAFHDDLMGAILARQTEMKAAYEDRLAEARARLDEAASRQLLERNSFKGKVNEVMSRQARLEQRGAIVAALAETEARNPSLAVRRQAATPNRPDAVSAIRALGPPTAAGASADGAVRAYAPLPEPERRASSRQASSDR